MQKGFTLLELLVVVLIIGILAGIALPQYQMAVMKSRYSAMMDIVNTMNDAEDRYYLLHDKYASTFDGLDIDLSGCQLSNDKTKCEYDWGYCMIDLGRNTDRIHCYNNTTLKNAYVRYLKYGERGRYNRACFAISTDKTDKYNQLCKNMGTKYSNADTCTGMGPCILYIF